MNRRFAIAVYLILSVSVSGQETGISWQTTLSKAFAAARTENAPVMLCIQRGGNSKYVRHLEDDPELIDLASRVVPVLLDVEESPDRLVAEARKLLATEDFTTPQLVLFRPDRSILYRRFRDDSSHALLDGIVKALMYHDPSRLPEVRRDDAKRTLVELRKELDELAEQFASEDTYRHGEAMAALVKRDDPGAIDLMRMRVRQQMGDIERLNAIKAMRNSNNAAFFPVLISLARDRSQQMRRNVLLTFRHLNLVEAVPTMLKCYGRDSSNKNRALILRLCAQLAPHDKAVRKILRKSFVADKPIMRIHASRAILDMPPTAKDYERLVALARGDTSATVRKSAVRSATILAIRFAEGGPLGEAQYASKIRGLADRKLKPGLRGMVAKHRSKALREYSEKCLEALKNGDEGSIAAGRDSYDIDALLFKEF